MGHERVRHRVDVYGPGLEAAAAVADLDQHLITEHLGPHLDLAGNVTAVQEGVDEGLVGRQQHLVVDGARHAVRREVAGQRRAQLSR